MIAVNTDVLKQIGLVFNKKCYEDVPYYMEEVYGHNMKTECIVHEDMLSINKGDNPLSRCGQCLELVGPTLKTITCMITQTFKFNETVSQEMQNNQLRSVGVNAEMLTLLTTDALGTDGIYNQITVREADCRFHLTPKLFVVDTNETTATLQVVNSNKVIEKITTDDEKYYITPDAHFYVPINSNLNRIVIHTLDGNSTSFFNVNLTTHFSYTSNVLMPIDEYDRCKFMPNSIVYPRNLEIPSTSNAFSWFYYTYDADLYLTEVTANNNQLIFTADETGEIRFKFSSKNVILMNHHFGMFYLTLKSKNNFNITTSVIASGVLGVSKVSMGNVRARDLYYEEHSYEEDGYIIKEFKFSIPLGFSYLSNNMAFRCSTIINGTVEVIDAYFSEKINNCYKSCDYNSSQCFDRECTYEGDEETDLPWIKGCEPECGRCRTGYQCSKEGKCIIETNYNMRSYSNHIIIFLIAFITFLIL